MNSLILKELRGNTKMFVGHGFSRDMRNHIQSALAADASDLGWSRGTLRE
jgi:hypothetical protein